jgi:hypothetical protein
MNSFPRIEYQQCKMQMPKSSSFVCLGKSLLLNKQINISGFFFFSGSNGLLDPWSSGGIMRNINKDVVAIIIPEGAHHLDLRGSDPMDPISVVKARQIERKYIKKWIDKSHKNDPKGDDYGPGDDSIITG